MSDEVLDLAEIDRTLVGVAGGKGAHLGELARIDGVRVPAGFCVTTDAYWRVVERAAGIEDQLDRLAALDPDDHEGIRARSAEIRGLIEGIAIPDDLAAAIVDALGRLGDRTSCAVRSSATAEDLPTASFAGQQDTYLNVVGPAAILEHVGRCWASLFTERAVTYRLRNGIDHRTVHMAVVVQEMVASQASGIAFTADPVSGNRKVVFVEAGFGLGEALVSGLVNPDVFQVRDGEIVARAVATKHVAIEALPGGGTHQVAIEPVRQDEPALADEEVLALAHVARRIEAHFGCPQDIEWCLADDAIHIVQSRPITTLFPIPASDDGQNHVYVSVGHGQMMTDAMKPLGLSVWQLIALPPMHEAGGRLFVDVTQGLASPATRPGILGALGKGDPLIGDALQTILERDGFLPSASEAGPPPVLRGEPPGPIEADPTIVTELIEEREASLATLEAEIATRSGPALLDFILEDIQEMKRIVFEPRSHQVIMEGMEATWWLNDHLEEWLGEKNAADTLAQSVPHNVTSEMGLALLDVADVIRPHPEVVAFLEQVEGDPFLDDLAEVDGGRPARDAIVGFLARYGMRCIGEIDITRPRWSERPSTLVPVILGNVRNFEPGEGRRRFEQGAREAQAKERDVVERLRALPDGEQKAADAKRMIDRVRMFGGYREYPKYVIVNRTFVYKRALRAEAERLAQAGALDETEDIFFLSFQELHEVVGGAEVDHRLVQQRKEAFESYRALTPPRVLTSDGEAVTGAYRRDDVPPGALVGLAVSSGTVEGRARVLHDIEEGELEAGDVLVTAFTDPSWTPVFVSIAGLVTEVGGLMTHGAVIAREYGLPAVVNVEHATRLIRDGQRIRVHGTEGYVEILDVEIVSP